MEDSFYNCCKRDTFISEYGKYFFCIVVKKLFLLLKICPIGVAHKQSAVGPPILTGWVPCTCCTGQQYRLTNLTNKLCEKPRI